MAFEGGPRIVQHVAGEIWTIRCRIGQRAAVGGETGAGPETRLARATFLVEILLRVATCDRETKALVHGVHVREVESRIHFASVFLERAGRPMEIARVVTHQDLDAAIEGWTALGK